MRRMAAWLLPGLAVGLLVLGPARRADACGCFAIPTPATPVLQAGERILFARDGNDIVAYIQIQYQGAADQFAWLVPLPSVPKVSIGTDELFSQLETAAAPRYLENNVYISCNGDTTTTSSGFGCGSSAFSSASTDGGRVGYSDMSAANGDIVVEHSSIGPYDYAVLKADNDTELTTWLKDNSYFVPANTDAALKPYLHSGAYFLALKLRGGESVGDLVPVVLRYPSDNPMIPITLTSVGAVPHMGILVYMLGEGRGVPLNYYHSVLNDLKYWQSVTTLPALIDRAVSEAPQHHTFFTQYHGPSSVVQRLDYSGRFGSATVLASLSDPAEYLSYLRFNGFTFTPALLAILQQALPVPAGVNVGQYYFNYNQYDYLRGYTDAGVPVDNNFDPVAVTAEIEERVVKPAKEAQLLLSAHPDLTRLYTTLSPEDMTVDPVFGWNKNLPAVSAGVLGTTTTPCRGSAWVENEVGIRMYINSTVPMPSTLRLETLGLEGPPVVVTDNTDSIKASLAPIATTDTQSATTSKNQGCGCGMTGDKNGLGMALLLGVVALGLMVQRRRRS